MGCTCLFVGCKSRVNSFYTTNNRFGEGREAPPTREPPTGDGHSEGGGVVASSEGGIDCPCSTRSGTHVRAVEPRGSPAAMPSPRCGLQADLEDAVKELAAAVPDGQELHLYLPDICRSRYDVHDLDSAIAPLLKMPPAEARIRPFRGVFPRRSRDALAAVPLRAGACCVAPALRQQGLSYAPDCKLVVHRRRASGIRSARRARVLALAAQPHLQRGGGNLRAAPVSRPLAVRRAPS